MNNKYYCVLVRKIELLRTQENAELDAILEDLEFDRIKARNKSESDFAAILRTRGYERRLRAVVSAYPTQIQIDFGKILMEQTKLDRDKYCPTCKIVLVAVENGECCDRCGFIDYSQPLYYGEKSSKRPSRSKENAIDNYCYDWLILLQGKGMNNVPGEVFSLLLREAVNFCTKSQMNSKTVNFHLVKNIRCADIRRWLSKHGASIFNKYISFIHMKITRELGHEIRPPQFTPEEEQIILSDWRFLAETYCREYKNIKDKNDKKKNNNPYYPVCIFFIVKSRFRNDDRARRLEEYIHKQSNETYRLRLQCWEKTCSILGYYRRIGV